MPKPKFIGIETEYNIYWDNPSDVGFAVTMMINLLKQDPINTRRVNPRHTRCFLLNGGLIYRDMEAPEYCTPESINPREVVAFDKAGELIVQELARKASVLSGQKIKIYKKNSDGFGNTSGCHENYSIEPDLFSRLTTAPWDDPKIRIWSTYLAIRQILVGGGKIGSEFDRMACHFQMSQRADFMASFRNNLTLDDRPIIQCRDEPLADGRTVKR